MCLNSSNAQSSGAIAGAGLAQQQAKPQTVAEFWDSQANLARQSLEHALIQRAKVEVLGIHNHPMQDLREFTFGRY